MISVWSSTEDCTGSKEVVSEGNGRETDRGGSTERKLLCSISPCGYPLILFTESPSAETIDSKQWQTE